MLKVFLGGEGNNDIGTRWYRPMGDQPGVIEVLLRRVQTTGWHVAGARSWQSIRKYRAGGALGKVHHADARDVLGLVLHAYEDACEMLAFVRDHDGDDPREQEIHRILAEIAGFGFVEEYRYELAIVGGVARPKLEGWILCLRGVTGTDEMSRVRVDRELAAAAVELKSTDQYVAIAESCVLPDRRRLAPGLAHAHRCDVPPADRWRVDAGKPPCRSDHAPVSGEETTFTAAMCGGAPQAVASCMIAGRSWRTALPCTHQGMSIRSAHARARA
jgi:hypothetical protein